VLSPPDVKYRRRGQGEVIERVNCGQWRIRNWFYESPEINSWGIIYFGDRPNGEVNNILAEFQNQFPPVNSIFFKLIFTIILNFSFSYFDVLVL
jgi:hypothetical protein